MGTLPDITVLPATDERWPDIARLFGANGACGGCWCMVWRLPHAAFERGKDDGNRDALRALVESGDVPGVLAYAGDEPIGWCAVAPRNNAQQPAPFVWTGLASAFRAAGFVDVARRSETRPIMRAFRPDADASAGIA